jgi:REP element-mobilizing transposase RayT
MRQPPYRLDRERRRVVLEAIHQVCSWREWTLLAAHVRTTHVHAVVVVPESAERVMNAFKSYASRTLNASGLDGAGRRRWARHGSTRYLWTRGDLLAAIGYVVRNQGTPMSVWEMPQDVPSQSPVTFP